MSPSLSSLSARLTPPLARTKSSHSLCVAPYLVGGISLFIYGATFFLVHR